MRRREGYAAAERRLATKTVTMCYVDESEILGKILFSHFRLNSTHVLGDSLGYRVLVGNFNTDTRNIYHWPLNPSGKTLNSDASD